MLCLTKNAIAPVVIILLAIATQAHAETLTGRVVGITDGDTFTLLTEDNHEIRIRVAEIDAPERGQPYVNRSRQALSQLIFQKDVSVDIQVVDRYGRSVGRPLVGETDVSAEMVRIGAAWVYRSYSDDPALYELERVAKAQSLGLWGLPEYQQTPPWEWRNGRAPARPGPGNAEAFKCGTKNYCDEMVSCAEAMFHLESCGVTRLDGDHDGVPCEDICR